MDIRRKIKFFILTHSNFGNICRYIYTCFFKRERLERNVSFGKINNKKVIYIIRPNAENDIQGLMSLFIQVMRKIDYANRNDYIPYVDFKNYLTQYYDGINNVWEYFFLQPNSLEYSEVYKYKNIILSGKKLLNGEDDSLYKDTIFYDEKKCEKCHNLITKNISFSNRVEELVLNELKNIDVRNCIGVYARGTDYTKLKPVGEHIQPPIDMIINSMHVFHKKYPEMDFFIVTEDDNIYQRIKKEFPKNIKIVSFDKFIKNYNFKGFLSESKLLDSNLEIRGLDYLVKLIILAKCECLISSITMGSIATYAMNGGKYKEKKIFNLGLYK
ncbi:hypothetical protein LB941_11975 [Ligilactobacillus sp. WILCCON 0076]|uniref:Uncharacterized protein n=1 Tax=Ligilactobacillus ubinensis TaxID=2876789 RepID=A0A9X2FM35_9LACO|nr:hypothetical protein [Ligilactobacillus ubinensis]MCP0888047.1 hypothetical protein [Ligilactobacillus ubinensis]